MYDLIYVNGGYAEFMGPSSAPKPTWGITSGILIEADTGKVFFFNSKTSEWVEQFTVKG